MSNRINRMIATIDNHICVWSSIPSFAPMAEILLNNRDMLLGKLMELTEGQIPQNGGGQDAVRLFLMDFALERMAGQITSEHFTIFRVPQTVEAVLEDSYETLRKARSKKQEEDPPLASRDILIPHQNEALKILIQCLFHRATAPDEEDLLCFFHMFSRAGHKTGADPDRTMRLKSMIWFIYLAIEIVQTERAVCSKGLEYFGHRFRQLMDCAIDGIIAGEEWEKTLFGRLRGEDRSELARKLKRQFNMENRLEHVGGRLSAYHRKAVLEQTMVMFCK